MNAPATVNNTPLNILLVDDDDGDAKAVERSFRKAKIANPLTRAVDGMEALEMLRGTNGKTKLPSPCVMLVDLNMPRINGIQFIQALRADKALHRSVVFVLTTSKRDEDKLAAYELNVAGYILKATAGADFMNLVNLVECYWRIVELP
jgi:CheY-like chemotaxis protein